MVTSAGTRNVISAEDLTQRVREQEGEIAPELLQDTLDRLSESRLVRRERRRELYLYEITSEFLVPWISHRRAELRRQQDRRRERRRMVILGSIAAVLLIVAAGVAALAVWALSERAGAINAQHAAESEKLLGIGATATSDLQLASLFALEAYRLSATVDARSAILNVVDSSRLSFGLIGHNGLIDDVEFSPNGKTLASVGRDDTVRLWDVAGHRQIRKPIALAFAAFSVAFSPNGKTIAAGGDEGDLEVWSISTRRPLAPTLKTRSTEISNVTFSPNGKILAAAGDDKIIRLWDAATLHRLKPLIGDADVTSIAFSPNGKIIAAGGERTDRALERCSAPSARPTIARTSVDQQRGVQPKRRRAGRGRGNLHQTGVGGRGLIQLWAVRSGHQVGGLFTCRLTMSTMSRSARTAGRSLRVAMTAKSGCGTWRRTTRSASLWSVPWVPFTMSRSALYGRMLASGGDDGTVVLGMSPIPGGKPGRFPATPAPPWRRAPTPTCSPPAVTAARSACGPPQLAAKPLGLWRGNQRLRCPGSCNQPRWHDARLCQRRHPSRWHSAVSGAAVEHRHPASKRPTDYRSG